MADLTSTAIFTKKFLIGLGLFCVGLVVLFVFWIITGNIKETLFPAKGDPALIAFDKLPPVNFTEGVAPPSTITYQVETITGEFEELDTMFRVFGVQETFATFGDQENADIMAKKAGFEIPAMRVEVGKAVYRHPQDPSKTLEIETTTGNAFLNSDYFNNQSVITSQIENEDFVRGYSDTFIRSFYIEPKSYEEDKVQKLFWKADGGSLVEAFSLSGANILQINYYPPDIDGIPIKSPLKNRPKVRVLVSNDGVVAAKVSQSFTQKHKFSTYPLKGVRQAFEDLKAGRASYNQDIEGDVFKIRSVSLAYYDTEKYEPYLQPVYVFHTDDDLEAYVAAVSDQYVDVIPK